MSSTRTAIIIAGGDALRPSAVLGLVPDAFVIAADSGLDHARAAGIRANMLVGDLDSVSPDALAWARAEGIRIEEHPADKDATDTELAIAAAVAAGAEHVVLLGGGGDRLDHTLGAITALGHPTLARCASVTARWGDAELHIVHGPRVVCLPVAAGMTFSLLALHGECCGVGVIGARWPLRDASIQPASSRGISNETLATEIRVEVKTGVLTIIFPTRFGGER